MTVILIPCKSLDQGKSRLASVLNQQERARLCERFLDRTLSLAVEAAGSDRVVLVSADGRAGKIAEAHNVSIISCERGDLNATLDAARSRIIDERGSCSLLILPIDLPNASVRSLRSLLRQQKGVVVVPDLKKSGTNALCLGADAMIRFPFCFGDGSLARHTAAASGAGIALQIIEDDDLAVDIDEPADYGFWLARTRS